MPSDSADEAALRDYKCDVLVKSIGYKSVKMEGVPFDPRRNVIPHEFGCVKDLSTGELKLGLYVAGWIKRGPVGIVDATLRDSMETFKMLKHHLDTDMLPEKTGSIEDTKALFKKTEGVAKNFSVIDKENWHTIKEVEIGRGKTLGKVKEKIIERSEMFTVVAQKPQQK